MIEREATDRESGGPARAARGARSCAWRAASASEIELLKDGVAVNGKSIMGVMMLAAECGSSITIRANGADAEQAVEAHLPARGRRVRGAMSESRVVRGIGVSPGVAMAPALIVQWEFPDVPDRTVAPDQVEVEVKRLREAVAEVVAQLHELGQKVLRRAGPEEARIFDAQILMAQDEEFLNSVESPDPQEPASAPRPRTSSRRSSCGTSGPARRGCASASPICTPSSSG